MKFKIFALFFLGFFSANIYARWVPVTISADNTQKYYVESESIKKIGNTFRAWTLVDYQTKNQYGNLSHKAYFEIDCVESRIRNISYTFFTENMGKGVATSYTPDKSEWVYGSPESINDYIIKFVCRPRWD